MCIYTAFLELKEFPSTFFKILFHLKIFMLFMLALLISTFFHCGPSVL